MKEFVHLIKGTWQHLLFDFYFCFDPGALVTILILFQYTADTLGLWPLHPCSGTITTESRRRPLYYVSIVYQNKTKWQPKLQDWSRNRNKIVSVTVFPWFNMIMLCYRRLKVRLRYVLFKTLGWCLLDTQKKL